MVDIPARCLLLLLLGTTAFCQLAAVYSDASRNPVCSHWSSWGSCIWPNAQNQSYLEQISPLCKKHWFYTFVGRYKSALDNFYSYMSYILKSEKPCGLCSYKQSCGFGGDLNCHLSPFTGETARPVVPFFVAERVCAAADLGGHSQVDSCVVDYQLTKDGNEECKLWPSSKVDLSAIEPAFRQHVESLVWYNCIPQTKRYRKGKGARRRYRKEKVCRCCCFPFRPNPETFKCEHIAGQVAAPGMEMLDDELKQENDIKRV